jgi:hypothetical protein
MGMACRERGYKVAKCAAVKAVTAREKVLGKDEERTSSASLDQTGEFHRPPLQDLSTHATIILKIISFELSNSNSNTKPPISKLVSIRSLVLYTCCIIMIIIINPISCVGPTALQYVAPLLPKLY